MAQEEKLAIVLAAGAAAANAASEIGTHHFSWLGQLSCLVFVVIHACGDTRLVCTERLRALLTFMEQQRDEAISGSSAAAQSASQDARAAEAERIELKDRVDELQIKVHVSLPPR
jgi:hypothetical protein